MKLSVHQSQYLPYSGYFHKIANSDIFVFLDKVQYKKREFQNRNRILDSREGKAEFRWLTVPVLTKGKFDQIISEVKIDNERNWQKEHWETIKQNYCRASHFEDLGTLLSGIYEKEWEYLTQLSDEIIFRLLDYLEIKTEIKYESKLDTGGSSTERIINICKKLGADTYLSGQGGKDYMDMEMFGKSGIKCEFQDFNPEKFKYRQVRQSSREGQLSENFVPYLSVIDLVVNEGKNSINIICTRNTGN